MSFVTIKAWLAGLCVVALAGCGGGAASDAGTAVLPGGGAGTPVLGGTPKVTLALAVTLLDSNSAATTAILPGQPVQVRAILTRNGQAISGEVVQFAVDTQGLIKIDPVSGSQLSDDNGFSSVTASSLGSTAGAGRITATATVGGLTAVGGANFFASGSVGTQPSTLTLGPIVIGSPSVSAYGTTSAEVTVLQNGTAYPSPVTVNFTTSCAAGKASITPSATTQSSGKAVATFTDNGCAQTADSTVTITASIGTDTKSGSMTVRAPTAGSLRFVSATPSDKSITLRGQGGNGRQENAVLTFQLVDVAGNGVGDADVCFDATTYVGDLNLDGFNPAKKPAVVGGAILCGTDTLSVVRYVKRTSADGKVSVQINSGTVPTPVRVRAKSLYPAVAAAPLETFSDTLSISTGLPLQRSFSLSVDKANIDGGNFDGEVATLSVRLADQFSNPVPDGTVVNFVASGGAVCTADNGSCKTVNGACSCAFVSQARRPKDGRVVVLAYAVGLEDFDDFNGNNVYDIGEPKYDLGDAYVDANKDGQPGSGSPGLLGNPKPLVNITKNGDTDILIPYQSSSLFSVTGDGVRGTAHIRSSTVIYLSQASSIGDPTVVLPLTQLTQQRDLFSALQPPYFLRLPPTCPAGSPVPQATLSMALDDGFGNPMAYLTSLAVADASDNVAPAAFRPGSVLAIGARPPSPLVDQPNLPKTSPWTALDAKGNVVTNHSVTVRGVQDKCAGSASFALEVASPRGGKASARILYDGEPRTTSRYAFDVRYLNSAFDFSIDSSVKAGSITAANFIGSAEISKYSIDWGDVPKTGIWRLPVLLTDRKHPYVNPGTYDVTFTLYRMTLQSSLTFAVNSLISNFPYDIDISTILPALDGEEYSIDFGDFTPVISVVGTPTPKNLQHVYAEQGQYTAVVRKYSPSTVQAVTKTITVP